MSSHVTLPPVERTGIIVIGHGSRRPESNALLLEMVELFRRSSGYSIVEPAHLELADPPLEAAFDRCVAHGAALVVIHPFLLLPGRHWDEDIPRLAACAAARHPGIRFRVTAPLGPHPLLAEIMRQRIDECLGEVPETQPLPCPHPTMP